MPNHWTYKPFRTGDDLSQGDIIARTGPLLGALKNIHAYFCDRKYLCFIVLTQSCDLVQRGGSCKARQIGLGVVRALDEVFPDILAELCGTTVPGMYRQDAQIAARQFLERVLNQNEQGHGLFYLHPDADVGIAVPAVAMLRVSISLRSREHYQTLKDARRGCLDTEYRNKLGWLTGNLYSRVDTTDWADHDGGKDTSERLIDQLLKGAGSVEPNVWVPEAWLEAAKAKRVDLKAIPPNQAYATLERLAPPPPLTVALDRVRTIASKLLNELNDAQLERLTELARADAVCALLAAQVAFRVARTALGTAGNELAVFLERLPADARMSASIASLVSQAVERFKSRKGAREIAPLLGLLREAPLFDAAATDGACEIAGEVLGEAFAVRRDAFAQALQAERPSEPVLARLHGLVREVVDGALIDKLAGRLENDGPFKGALKRG